MPAWIRALIWLSGRDIQRETIKIILDAGYVDGYRYLHHGSGRHFPDLDPHLRLDYIFVPSGFAAQLQSCRIIDQPAEVAVASDHFPLLGSLDSNRRTKHLLSKQHKPLQPPFRPRSGAPAIKRSWWLTLYSTHIGTFEPFGEAKPPICIRIKMGLTSDAAEVCFLY